MPTTTLGLKRSSIAQADLSPSNLSAIKFDFTVSSRSMNTALSNFKELPISERIQLVEDLWDSIAEETPGQIQLSQQDRVELHRRLSAHHADPSTSLSWEQVRASLFKGQN